MYAGAMATARSGHAQLNLPCPRKTVGMPRAAERIFCAKRDKFIAALACLDSANRCVRDRLRRRTRNSARRTQGAVAAAVDGSADVASLLRPNLRGRDGTDGLVLVAHDPRVRIRSAADGHVPRLLFRST